MGNTDQENKLKISTLKVAIVILSSYIVRVGRGETPRGVKDLILLL